MKSTSDQEQILYSLIKNSALDVALNGGIYIGERPLSSSTEDVVITAMLTGDGTLQEGVCNVNIYIKKLSTSINAVNQLIKDTKRISEVLPIALNLLKEGAGTYYSFWVSKQAEYDEPEINQTRLNFRVEFRLDNTIT